MSTWSAPVRYAEVDQQGVVFNAHYLLYCDEAMTAFFAERGMLEIAERMHVVAANLSWRAPVRWGDTVEVASRCVKVGRSSVTMGFEISAGGRACCSVVTTYVLAEDGRPTPLPDDVRARLS